MPKENIMKLLSTKNFFIIIIIIFFLISCNEEPTPTKIPPSPTLPPIRTPTPTPMILPPISISNDAVFEEPDSLAIEFLVDISGSVRTNCSKNLAMARYGWIRRMTDIFHRTIQPTLREKLFISIGLLGDDYTSFVSSDQLYAPISLRFPEEKDPKVVSSDTEYVNGLIESRKRLKDVSEANRKLIVLVTDGELESNGDDVKEQFENMAQESNFSVIVALVCKGKISEADYDFWSNRIDVLENIYVTESLEATMIELLRKDDKNTAISVNNFLSPNSEVFLITSKEATKNIPGYAHSFTVDYWNSDINNLLNIVGMEGFSYEDRMTPNEISESPPLPNFRECNQYSYKVSLSTEGKGVVIVTYRNHDNLLKLELVPNVVVNNHTTYFRITVKDSEQNGTLANCACFAIDIVDKDGARLGEPISCDENSPAYVCYDPANDEIAARWRWDPPQFESPQEFPIYLRFLGLNVEQGNGGVENKKTGNILAAKNQNLLIKFRAEYNTSIPDQIPEITDDKDGLSLVQDVAFKFNNVVNIPEIYWITSLDKGLLEITSDANTEGTEKINTHAYCPGIAIEQQEFDNKLGIKVEIPMLGVGENCNDISPEKIGTFCRTDDIGTYVFSAPSYALARCKFNNIYFVWRETELSEAITWQCTIKLGSKIFCTQIN
jgi:hypothetical protein